MTVATLERGDSMDGSKLSFAQLREQVFRLYGQQRWQDALALVEREGAHFDQPAQAARVVFWRACFLCLLDRADDGMAALQHGLARGLWWAELSLRGDPDLRSLQGRADLEALIAKCNRRRQAAQAGVKTSRLIAEPDSSVEPPYPLLLALHGYGSNAVEMLAVCAPLAERGWLVAALQSSQLAGMDGYHWVDEAQARRDVQEHLDALSALYQLDPARLTVAGFSNGARIALMLTLTGAIPARAAVSIGSSVRDETLAALDWDAIRAADPRLLLIVGDLDQPVLARMTPQVARFQDSGLQVDLQIVPGLGHTVPDDFIERLWAWLQRPLP